MSDIKLTQQNEMLLKEILSDMTQDEMDMLASEGIKIKRQTWDTKSIMDKRIAKVCMLLAKQNNDILYYKFVKFFKLSRVWRARLRAKYWGKAKSLVVSSGNLYEGSLSAAIKQAEKKNNPN